jgi:uncharacterized membrane protein
MYQPLLLNGFQGRQMKSVILIGANANSGLGNLFFCLGIFAWQGLSASEGCLLAMVLLYHLLGRQLPWRACL